MFFSSRETLPLGEKNTRAYVGFLALLPVRSIGGNTMEWRSPTLCALRINRWRPAKASATDAGLETTSAGVNSDTRRAIAFFRYSSANSRSRSSNSGTTVPFWPVHFRNALWRHRTKGRNQVERDLHGNRLREKERYYPRCFGRIVSRTGQQTIGEVHFLPGLIPIEVLCGCFGQPLECLNLGSTS